MIYQKIIFFYLQALLFLLLPRTELIAQTDTSYSDFGGIIYLDSFVVTASRKGFSVDDFIKMVQEDESFYQSFKNLRFASYTSDNDIQFFDKKGKLKTSYSNQIRQQVDAEKCRTMEIMTEKTNGKFFKKQRKNKPRRYKFFTAKMYDRLFFTNGRVCETKGKAEKQPRGMAKYIAELKKLIFKPGSKAKVPLIGKKMEIFSPKMAKYYDYHIQSKKYKGKIDCYVFQVIIKPEYRQRKKGKTVIKFLETYFDRTNFQVIARNYQLNYNSALFDFNVKMEIELTKWKDKYIPHHIYYDGFWDVPLKKRETGKFTIDFYNFN
ncbi:MAG: hypothetical protein AB8G15_10975 [Saprospiraceae bacterium]